MTLFKQILIIISVIFSMLLVSSLYITTENIRDYLDEQLASHAQDGATSLGIALTSEISQGDIVTLEVYTNAMFDSGYYQEIQIKDVDDKILFQKKRDLLIEQVPEWFTTLFPLRAPFQNAVVDNGWQTIGVISIQSYPGLAYKKLWDNTLNTLQLYGLVIIIILLFTGIALNYLLKPLLKIQEQAYAICHREFPIIDIKPKTIEFQQVITALNKMSVKLKSIFSEQAVVTEELQKQAFQDNLTGLANRSLFMKQLRYFCELKKEANRGCLIIMQLNNLVQINKEYGHIKANNLIIKLAELLAKNNECYPNSLVARLSGSEFALLIKTITPEFIAQVGENFHQELAKIAQSMGFSNEDIAHIGMVRSDHGQSMSELLAKADLALRLAQQKGINAYHLYDNQQTNGLYTEGSDEWHTILIEALENDRLQLYFQKTVDSHEQTKFQEVMLRLNYKQQVISAGIFIPMAEYLQITGLIDRWVITKISEKILSGSKTVYCINLSRDALQDPVFPVWLVEQMKQLTPEQQRQVVLEVPEYNVIKAMSEYKNLLYLLKSYSCHFSIDHFGIGFASMVYLQELKIDYIKVHGSYASHIKDNHDIVNYMRQIISTAHNLDIKIIAEGIEKEADLSILQAMQLDFFQGYFIGKPSPEEK